MFLVTVDVNLDNLIKIASARLLCFTFFLFVVKKYFIERYF